MARYQSENGTILDTVLARLRWPGRTGRAWTRGVSTAETLYCSPKGQYWLEHVSNWRGIAPTVRVLTPREAATWLLMQHYDLPADLIEIAKNSVE